MLFAYVCAIFVTRMPLSQLASDFIRPKNIRGCLCLSSATRLCSTACYFVNFVSTVMKIADNMQNIVVKYVPEFGIDCMRSFCVILFCPRVLENRRFVRFTRNPSRPFMWNCPYRWDDTGTICIIWYLTSREKGN